MKKTVVTALYLVGLWKAWQIYCCAKWFYAIKIPAIAKGTESPMDLL
ncbi:hypothetical protein SMB34_10015 [Thalassospira permensis NBRC 106175]|uniref:Uncharacterized protein n=1 Tax=Thalassospira permensis NBRC 106175 TaxID=1353532 RepID=A0ABR4TJ84_9PROT|nr:hypothetical protein SMB34_10015 [Thalassospira permensis NBRC 106175]